LMEDLLRKTPRAVSLSIHDGTEPSAENLFYQSGDETGEVSAKFVHREAKVVGGRTWTLTYASLPDLEARGATGRSTPVLAGGLLASLLLFGMVWSLATTRARALRLAGAMTSSLRESEQSLAITLHSIGDAVIATDPEGRVTRMNSAAERLSGWSLAEARNRPLAEIFHIVNADTREAIADPVHLVITRGQEVGLANHTLLLSRDGREYQISESAAPIRNPAGEIVGAVLVFSDITEKYRIEAALRESRKQYLNLVEGTPDLVTKVDMKGRFVFVNSSSMEFFGLPPDQCIGRPAFDFVAPEDHAATVAAFDRWLASGEEISKFENRQVGVDGRVHTLAWVIRAERDDAGTLTGFASTGRDVSERKRTEEALRIAAAAFESQEGMSITNAEGVILRINKAFTEITGYAEDEVLGKNPRLLKSNRQDPAFYTAMWNSLKQSGAWQGEIWNRRKNGEVYPEWLSITAVKDGAGAVTHYVGSFTDITSRKLAQDEIMHLAFYDPLTRLPNRRLLLDRLKQALASSTRNKRYGSLLFIDLDNFKTLNDTLGHDIGDLLLQQVGERLTTCVREGDTVARLGGDEFVVMLEDLSENIQESATQTETVGEKILATLNNPYQLASYLHHSTPSIGVTLFADHQESLDELLKRADLAMYQAKAAGRNTLRFFDPGMQSIVTARAALEADLREAVLKSQFVLYYQAQVVGEGCKTGAEALVRWLHPQRGMVSPAEFIPLAEDTGLILPLGQWVLQTACDQLALWATRPEMAHLTIAVNISARQFRRKDFVDQVTAVLDQSGANPQRLKLELTESLLVHDVEDVIAKMAALKVKGVGFSLDDFGTGYSSLSYLKRLPLDQLKIDQGFVRDILTDPNDAAIAMMVVALAESLGLAVIAEGVENEAQRDFLARNGCHSYQGYLFSRPLPVSEFEEYVKRIALP
ncbi:MAG: EAL domain-containing protein, partial [Sterolibacterium sp.]